MTLLRSNWVRGGVVLTAAVGVGVLLWLHGPSWEAVASAFTVVRWQWVVAAIGINLASVIVRAVAWRTVIKQAMPGPHPSYMLVFSAFSIGLFGNAVVPGRVGELARVAVLTRKVPQHEGAWATLVGTVLAHRVFDIVAAMGLVVYVVLTADIPQWAGTSLFLVVVLGMGLFTFAVLAARRHSASVVEGLSTLRKFVRLARHGLGVMHEPVPALIACLLQFAGWFCQLVAVYVAMRAFDVHAPLPAAGLVLVLMNIATIFPLWPGNVGIVQAAIALPLLRYGIPKGKGVAFGFGLQAIEASVGVGVGLIFLAREGLSYAMLKVMPDASQAEVPAEPPAEVEEDAPPPRAGVPG